MNLESYLKDLFGGEIRLINKEEIGKEESIKDFGYGKPYLIEFKREKETKKVVLSTMKGDSFGHDHFSDRAQTLLWQHDSFNRLPKHVKSLDVGFFTKDGEMRSARDAEEFFLLTDLAEGEPYANDLDRIRKTGMLEEFDMVRVKRLSSYLSEIRAVKRDDPELYLRKIRDTVGHGECIFGLTDSYPENLDYITPEELCEIEEGCIKLRWKLKGYKKRLCMVHGDFHPWNILFRPDNDFTLLDRSRGEWGEAADDLSSLTMNYIFYSLLSRCEMGGSFEKLFIEFYRDYMDKTGDIEILNVIQLFYVFRALVVASPIWYPDISKVVRKKLFNFVWSMLDCEEFDYEDVNRYL
jgi:thiamine kinase-like enzyme